MTTLHPCTSDENLAELQHDPFFDLVADCLTDVSMTRPERKLTGGR